MQHELAPLLTGNEHITASEAENYTYPDGPDLAIQAIPGYGRTLTFRKARSDCTYHW